MAEDVLEYDEIVAIEEAEEAECFDITLLEEDVYLAEPNFIAEGIVVHNCGMDQTYCDRKNGREKYELHPLIAKTLEPTYGVLVYQEQVMEILRLVGKVPDMHTEKVRKAISKKKEAVIAKYRELFIKNGKETIGETEEYLSALYENIAAFSAYGFNKSHAYAYSYISARLLYLKAHYPLEFFCATFQEESDQDKIKAYKVDAARFGVKLERLHLNKSKVNFSIQEYAPGDERIYYGFSNVKGIGVGPAEKIVEHQPYTGIVDFVQRCKVGDDVVKRLIALGAFDEFEEQDHLTLRRFSTWYQRRLKNLRDRTFRNKKKLEEKDEDLKKALLEEITEDDPDFDLMNQYTDEAQALWEKRFAKVTRIIHKKYRGEIRPKEVPFTKILIDLRTRRQTTIDNYELKREVEYQDGISLNRLDLSAEPIADVEYKCLADYQKINGELTYPTAEREYLGFNWSHRIEGSEDYTGATFASFFDQVAEAEGRLEFGYVEVALNKVTERKSKKGSSFYTLELEDANGEIQMCNMWLDDYIRFKNRLIENSLISIQVKPPSGGFSTLTFNSVPRHLQRTLPKPEDDHRLIIMRDNKEELEILSMEDKLQMLAGNQNGFELIQD